MLCCVEDALWDASGFDQMRLKAGPFPDPMHHGMAGSQGFSQGAGAPVGRVGGLGFQSSSDGCLHLGVGDRTRNTRTRFVNQALQSACGETVSPLADGWDRDAELIGDCGVGVSVGGALLLVGATPP